MTDNPAAKRFTRRKKTGMQEKSFPEKCQLEIDPKRGYCYFWPFNDFLLIR